MRVFGAMVLAALTMTVCAPAFANDKEKKVVVSSKEVRVEKKEVKVEEKKRGNWFTRFWTDDVGNTIYRGLKKGSSKIANTFD